MCLYYQKAGEMRSQNQPISSIMPSPSYTELPDYNFERQYVLSQYNIKKSAISDHEFYRPFYPTQSVIALRSFSNFYAVDELSVSEKPIGMGYYATVYLAYNHLENKYMALKRPEPTELPTRFQRETSLIRQLNHENILKYHGICVFKGKMSSLTEYLEGGCLSSLISENARFLDWPEKVDFAMDIAKGLSYLHQLNYAHRDLSSENILVRLTLPSNDTSDSNQRPLSKISTDLKMTAVLADFGLCLSLSQTKADRTSCVGNPFYIAPECLKHIAPYSLASDVFAFGLLMCEIITWLVNDGQNIPRTNNFGLDYNLLPVPHGCPDWFLQLAYNCCVVHHYWRPTMDDVLSDMMQNLRFVRAWWSPSIRTGLARPLSVIQTGEARKDECSRYRAVSVSGRHYRRQLNDNGACGFENTSILIKNCVDRVGVSNGAELSPWQATLSSANQSPVLTVDETISLNLNKSLCDQSIRKQLKEEDIDSHRPTELIDPSGSNRNEFIFLKSLRRRRYSVESIRTHHTMGLEMSVRDPCYINAPLLMQNGLLQEKLIQNNQQMRVVSLDKRKDLLTPCSYEHLDVPRSVNNSSRMFKCVSETELTRIENLSSPNISDDDCKGSTITHHLIKSYPSLLD